MFVNWHSLRCFARCCLCTFASHPSLEQHISFFMQSLSCDSVMKSYSPFTSQCGHWCSLLRHSSRCFSRSFLAIFSSLHLFGHTSVANSHLLRCSSTVPTVPVHSQPFSALLHLTPSSLTSLLPGNRNYNSLKGPHITTDSNSETHSFIHRGMTQ